MYMYMYMYLELLLNEMVQCRKDVTHRVMDSDKQSTFLDECGCSYNSTL